MEALLARSNTRRLAHASPDDAERAIDVQMMPMSLPTTERAKSATILYVEDDPASVALMQDLLGVFDGVTLATAPNAELGLHLARKLLPDVIIMDLNLPGLSGPAALGFLREWPETAGIPVIALSAMASGRERDAQLRGFDRCLPKPLNVDRLESTIVSLLGHPTAS
jgi:CheY-like chemotaxis protein